MPVLLAVLNRTSATAQAALPIQQDVVLDDAAALAIWGAKTTVDMLRAMLVSELEPYRDALLQSCTRHDQPALREHYQRRYMQQAVLPPPHPYSELCPGAQLDEDGLPPDWQHGSWVVSADEAVGPTLFDGGGGSDGSDRMTSTGDGVTL